MIVFVDLNQIWLFSTDWLTCIPDSCLPLPPGSLCSSSVHLMACWSPTQHRGRLWVAPQSPRPQLPVCFTTDCSPSSSPLLWSHIHKLFQHGYSDWQREMLLQLQCQVFLWDQWQEHQRSLEHTWLCDRHYGHAGLLYCHLLQCSGHSGHFKKQTFSLSHLLPAR